MVQKFGKRERGKNERVRGVREREIGEREEKREGEMNRNLVVCCLSVYISAYYLSACPVYVISV